MAARSFPNNRRPSTALSQILPPLIFGTAAFNYQYNPDPYALDTTGLVAEALSHGVRAFDTSPYYGPSEELLGAALSTRFCTTNFRRSEYFLLTKVGRIAESTFDYSAEWVRQSISRSLRRLHTSYLDVVYCHDVEYVSDDQVLAAVKELRRIRDEDGSIKYIGISGYPLPVLCRLAHRVLAETGEPLDAVMSYGHFTLQNALLANQGIAELKRAGVDVVPNASPLGMGLLRRAGPPVGKNGVFHPAPTGLLDAVRQASDFCDRHGETLEVIAIRYSLESWLLRGSAVGSGGNPASGVPWLPESNSLHLTGRKLGVSVMGVSKKEELEKTLQVWRSILDGLEDGETTAARAGRWKRDHEWSLNRKRAVQILAEGIMECLDGWLDTEWDANQTDEKSSKRKSQVVKEVEAPWPTPEASPEPGEGNVVEKHLPLR